MRAGGLHMFPQIVQVRFEVTCSLNAASSLLCWSPILLLISTQSSETRATSRPPYASESAREQREIKRKDQKQH